MSSESLNAFREIVSDVFRLTMQAAAGKYRDCPDSFDRFLCTAMSLIESKENMKETHTYLEKSMSNTVTEAFLSRDMIMTPDPPHLIIQPVADCTDDMIPNVVVTKDAYSENSSVIEEPVEAEPKSMTLSNYVAKAEETAEANQLEEAEESEEEAEAEAEEEAEEESEEEVEAESEEEAEEEVEAESEEEAEEEVEAKKEVEETEKAEEAAEAESEEAEEEAEVEDDDFDIEKIGKKKYFVGKPTNRVYVFLSEDEYGDCIGKLENGKIVPL